MPDGEMAALIGLVLLLSISPALMVAMCITQWKRYKKERVHNERRRKDIAG